jgi:hypothetical protein
MAAIIPILAITAAQQRVITSGRCLLGPLVRVSPDIFLELIASIFTIVHIKTHSRHLYMGRFIDHFVIYTLARTPLDVPVDVEAEKITKTIHL